MNRLGFVGGLGPESTIDYYRRILETCRRQGLKESPSIVIDSLDVDRGLYLSGNDRTGLIRVRHGIDQSVDRRGSGLHRNRGEYTSYGIRRARGPITCSTRLRCM